VETIGVVVVHDDPSIARAVAEAVEAAPGLFVAGTSLGNGSIGGVAVVGGSALFSLEPGPVPVVALADGEPIRAARAALAAGARDIVRWPDERDRVPGALRRAASSREAAPGSGKVVAIAGARGGIGTTTLAVALCARIADAVLLDLDRVEAAVGAFARDEPVRTLDGLGGALSDLDAEALVSALVPVAGGGRALAASPGPEPSRDAVDGLLRAAREATRVTIVDAGRAAGEGARAALASADVRVLVVGNDVASVRGARPILDRVPARWSLVVRRTRRTGVALRDLSAALGVPPTVVIPSDASLSRAADLGRLPVRPTKAMRAAGRLARAIEGTLDAR